MKGVRVSDGASFCSLRPPGSAKPRYPRACNENFISLIHFISLKREIGHLCHDESKPGKPNTTAEPQTTAPAPASLASGMSASFGSNTSHRTSSLPLFLGARVVAVSAICPSAISHLNVDANVITTHVAPATPYSALVTPAPSWPGTSSPQSTYPYPTESFGREFSSLS
jgi:hypothetical protein